MADVKPIFALIDCNNFFVSCERVFRPDLWYRPVVVLSNNDSCIVARSNEVKALGVPMGAPYFKVRDALTRNNVTLFSGNFSLYGDFSQRVVHILQDACPDVEVYSVDESFLEISRLPIKNYEQWGCELAARIFKFTGIPVSVGIAPSKTLAKAAADFVKKSGAQNGAYSVAGGDAKREQLLKWLPLAGVWGVGWRTAPKLQAQGLQNAYALSRVSDGWALKQLGVRGLKIVRELRGQSCYGLENTGEPQKSIERTRSFGHNIRNYYELEGAVATFAAQAAAKLRAQGEIASGVLTFLRTPKHADNWRGISQIATFHPATADTGAIIAAALNNLARIYDSDFAYQKAGVALFGLHPAGARQLAFTDDPAGIDRQQNLMQTVDDINARFGARLVRHASEHIENTSWHSRRERRSPAYTTSWAELRAVSV